MGSSANSRPAVYDSHAQAGRSRRPPSQTTQGTQMNGTRRSSATMFCGVIGAILLVAGRPAAASAQWDPSEVRSSLSGVYTEGQADEGLEIFNTICAGCHNARNPLAGHSFMRVWSGKSLYRLYEFVSTRMPYGNPGSLTAEQYASVVAYVLRRNGYPAGDTPIPVVPLEIAYINFDPHPEPR